MHYLHAKKSGWPGRQDRRELVARSIRLERYGVHVDAVNVDRESPQLGLRYGRMAKLGIRISLRTAQMKKAFN